MAESERARSDLRESRSVDREKGLSSEANGLSEHEACRPTWSAAMRENDKIAEIAQLTIPASEQSK
jgi:AmiR/NasT family two-component response regulator